VKIVQLQILVKFVKADIILLVLYVMNALTIVYTVIVKNVLNAMVNISLIILENVNLVVQIVNNVLMLQLVQYAIINIL
jgi:hypothetical protein